MSKFKIATLAATAGLIVSTAPGNGLAQSTDQQMQQMEKKLDMNATPDMAALGFQDDLAALEECQSSCKPMIDRMLGKYKTDPKLGGNPKLGASDAAQLAAALATAAATLPKAEAEQVGSEVTASLGADAGAAFAGAYAGTTAPYNPQ
ncbi:hypothetical protein LB518_05710 [Mesorhizobium sp. BR1-1-16]|uniref:hypothetical protein n=1 Tax=Mesorhizobium sp. BR1-1-16 TaxID=2876653 RepID=UPI001CC926F1|nr:hypothetical protein [Mesorhizobium sp. BR1-1-16]MBZ9935778.1 hypothetical protein [Mesorhizobium sp. BR1-1-16]